MQIEDPASDRGTSDLQFLAPRINGLEGQCIGLYDNGKMAADPVLTVLREKLNVAYDDIEFREFHLNAKQEIADSENQERVREWAQGDIDACIGAIGDCGSCTKYLTWGIHLIEEEEVPAVGLIDDGFELDWQTNAIERGMALRYDKHAVRAEVRDHDLIAERLTLEAIDRIEDELTRPLAGKETEC